MAKFIVVDGLDGCGKATQVKAVAERLKAQGKRVITMSFPNYESNSSALVKMYLSGEITDDISKLNPYACASFYAVDRYVQYIKNYKKYFDEDDNTIILSDRYISANIIHQGGRIDNDTERHKFICWAYDYECHLHSIPREDRTIILSLKPEISQKLLEKRYSNDESKKDLLEKDVAYLNNCYNKLVDTTRFINSFLISRWELIDCTDIEKQSIQEKDIITDKIMAIIDKVIA